MAEGLLALLVLLTLAGIAIFMIRGLVRLVLVLVGLGLMALGLYACAVGFTPQDKGPKPKLNAAARATDRGWEVTVKGNAQPPYRILLDGQEVGRLAGPGTTVVGEYPLDHKEYRPGPVRTIKVVSRKDDVADSVEICAPVVILAARGTNENGKKIQFGHGVGSRAWRTWEYVQTDLGLPKAQDDVVVSAHPVEYPAEAIGASGLYPDSRNIGKRELAGMWFRALPDRDGRLQPRCRRGGVRLADRPRAGPPEEPRRQGDGSPASEVRGALRGSPLQPRLGDARCCPAERDTVREERGLRRPAPVHW